MDSEPQPLEPADTAHLPADICQSEEELPEAMHLLFPKSTCGHVEHTGLQDAREECWRHCGHIHHEAALSPCSPPLFLDQRLDSRMKHMD